MNGMTKKLSGLAALTLVFAAAAAAIERSVVHLSAACRRGATGGVFDDAGGIVTTARAVAGRDRVTVVQGEQSVEAMVLEDCRDQSRRRVPAAADVIDDPDGHARSFAAVLIAARMRW